MAEFVKPKIATYIKKPHSGYVAIGEKEGRFLEASGSNDGKYPILWQTDSTHSPLRSVSWEGWALLHCCEEETKVSLGGKPALLFPFNLFLHKMSPLLPDQFSCTL